MRLGSRAFMDPAPGEPPHVPLASVLAASEGLIALTGGPDGPIDRALAAGRTDLARGAPRASSQAAFGDRLYVEIQRHGLDEERAVERELLELAYRRACRIVGDQRALFRQAGRLRGARRAAGHRRRAAGVRQRAPARSRRSTTSRRARRWCELFADLPEALAPTRRDRHALHLSAAHGQADPAALHVGRWRRRVDEEAAELRRQAEEGLAARLAAHGPRRASPRRSIASGSISSSRSSSG